MLKFLRNWYFVANKRWHLNEMNKHLDFVSSPLCEKFKDGDRCSIGCPLLHEGHCAKEVIKEYTEHEWNELNVYLM